MSGSSNIDEIEAKIKALVDSVSFTMPGENQSLARDIVDLVVTEIADRTLDRKQQADGTALKANSPAYAAYKARRYKVDPHAPLVRTGQLLSQESLRGRPIISANSIEMRYGTGQPPAKAASGVPLSKADQNTTDLEKAKHVSKDRPFYELDDDIAEKVVELAGRVILKHFKDG
ncbi:hypothetical protein [Singulisphaera sp. PoT]|uniref:hypothetical protein n=1 Tax=Singulisphaera sp. PoT TaxID=3411797 RepID=UPI003BF5FE23